MRKFIVAAAALILIAGIAFAERGEDPAEKMGPGHHGMMEGMGMEGCHGAPMMGCLRGIELTDDQRAQMEKGKLHQEKIMVARKADMAQLQSKLKLAIVADKFDQGDVNDIVGKIAKFHQDGLTMHIKHMRAVRDMLTPDQRVTFDQNVLAMGPGMGEGMGGGMGRGMGPGMGECKDCEHGKSSGWSHMWKFGHGHKDKPGDDD